MAKCEVMMNIIPSGQEDQLQRGGESYRSAIDAPRERATSHAQEIKQPSSITQFFKKVFTKKEQVSPYHENPLTQRRLKRPHLKRHILKPLASKLEKLKQVLIQPSSTNKGAKLIDKEGKALTEEAQEKASDKEDLSKAFDAVKEDINKGIKGIKQQAIQEFKDVFKEDTEALINAMNKVGINPEGNIIDVAKEVLSDLLDELEAPLETSEKADNAASIVKPSIPSEDIQSPLIPSGQAPHLLQGVPYAMRTVDGAGLEKLHEPENKEISVGLDRLNQRQQELSSKIEKLRALANSQRAGIQETLADAYEKLNTTPPETRTAAELKFEVKLLEQRRDAIENLRPKFKQLVKEMEEVTNSISEYRTLSNDQRENPEQFLEELEGRIEEQELLHQEIFDLIAPEDW